MCKINIFNLLPTLLFLLSCGNTTQKSSSNIEKKEQVIRIDTQKSKNQKITIFNEKGDFFLAIDFVQEQIIFSEDTISISDYEAEKTDLTEKYNFFPLIFFPEYELMDFEALGKNQTSNRYLIKLGNNHLGYIQTSEGVNAVTWENYLLNKGVVMENIITKRYKLHYFVIKTLHVIFSAILNTYF
ncbi:MAG: hypothetical protein RLZZ292_1446 [Bacteroidota bacterium]